MAKQAGHNPFDDKPKAALLVREAPDLVRYESLLTDGKDAYRVVDSHSRYGVMHFRLVNVNDPDHGQGPPRFGWFSIDELGELAFAKGERREKRERF